jgi:hypothetical protein
MTKPQKRTQVVKTLRDNGCQTLRNVGGHEIWGCPCGSHTAPLPNHREVTPEWSAASASRWPAYRRDG